MANPELIIEYRGKFRKNKFAVEHVWVRNRQYAYYVIPRDWSELPTDLPQIFAFQMVSPLALLKAATHPDTVCLFGVSDTIPENYRPLVALHEVEEYSEQYLATALAHEAAGHTAPERPDRACYNASLSEYVALQAYPASVIPSYATMRACFFRELVPYVTKAGYPPHLIEQFRESERFWNELNIERSKITRT